MYEIARAGRGRRGQSAMTFIKFGARVRGKRNKNAEISARSLQILDGLKQKEVFHL